VVGVAASSYTLWLDEETGLPLKRQIGQAPDVVTETYTFTLDPKIEGDPFRLQDALDRKAGADKILRDMEQKVRSAKARRIVVDIEERDGDKVNRLSGYVILAEGDRARLEMMRTTGDKKETWKLVCDGKRVLGQGGPFDTEGKPEE